MLGILLAGIFTYVLSYLGVAVLMRWAQRQDILDIPNERSSHSRPTPRGGGLVIVLLCTVGLAVACHVYPAWSPAALIAFLIAAWLIAFISWWDDLRSLPNWARFTAHSVAAILVILAFGYWRVVEIPPVGPLHLGLWGLVLTFLWIVGLTNAYNFMDGIDGIAGGQAVVAGIGWAVLGWLSGQPLSGILGFLVGATSLGFLGHNWPPAHIFMGDVGSAFLGFTLAVLPVIAARGDSRFVLAGLLFVWPFVFDASFTFLRRLRNGENVFAAHRSHLYQRLVLAGHSHLFVTSVYIGLAVVGLVVAFVWYWSGVGKFALPLIPILCLSLWACVRREERKQALKRAARHHEPQPL